MFRVYEVDVHEGVAKVVEMFDSYREADDFADERWEECEGRFDYAVVAPEQDFYFI